MFFPAWDKTDPDPQKNYGVSCLELCFLVEGEKGVVEFQLLTNWYQKHVMERRLRRMKEGVLAGKENFLLEKYISPFPADICCYSLTRLSEDDVEFSNGQPHILNHQPCYYNYKYTDESGFVAHDVAYKLLVEHGDEALWKYLEEYYVEVFGNESI